MTRTLDPCDGDRFRRFAVTYGAEQVDVTHFGPATVWRGVRTFWIDHVKVGEKAFRRALREDGVPFPDHIGRPRP